MASDSQGFVAYTRDDGIRVYEFYNARQTTAEHWYQTSIEDDQQAFDAQRAICRMMVIHNNLIPTPYFMAKLRAAAQQTPKGLEEHLAIVISSQLALRLVMSFINRLPDSHIRQSTRFFTTQEQALAWLQRFTVKSST